MRGIPRLGVVVRAATWLLLALSWASVGSAARAQGKTDLTRAPFLVNNLNGHSAPVTSLVFAPDGRTLFSGGFDKVVHVWDLGVKRDGRYDASMIRSLRPPIAHDLSGQIYTMAITPHPVEKGQYLLAVAGTGVRQALRGEILILQYPGKNNADVNGRIVAQLPKLDNADVDVTQVVNKHEDSVKALAFAPGGRYLASAGSDGKVFLWDLGDLGHPRAAAVATNFSRERPAQALVFAPGDGDRSFFVCGRDGLLERIDFSIPATPRAVDWIQTKRFTDEDVGMLLCLAISPDGAWLAAGEQYGGVLRFRTSARLVEQERTYEAWDGGQWVRGGVFQDDNPAKLTQQARGEIIALAFSPDGARLAVSGAARTPKNNSEPPVVEGAVRILDFPTGALKEEIRSSERVRACRFNPVDGGLAYSGGARHSIYLRPSDGDTATELKGSGWVHRQIGFLREPKLTLAVTGDPEDDGQRGTMFKFDLTKPEDGLKKRAAGGDPLVEPAAMPGLEVRPGALPELLRVVDRDGKGWDLELDKWSDIRWYCHAVIPADRDAGHPQWTIAVGTASGVGIYGWSDDPRIKATKLELKRFFAGHGGEVVALAVSHDNRWLASASTDQTIRLWPLKHCDQRARTGLVLAPNPSDRGFAAADVERFSYAEFSGLKKNDVVTDFYLHHSGENAPERKSTIDEFRAQEANGFSALHPVHFIVRRVERGVDRDLTLGARFSESPYISLFLGPNSSWIEWTPQGFYDADAKGEKEFLGWHLNHGDRHQWEPTSTERADKFRDVSRKPILLGILAREADPSLIPDSEWPAVAPKNKINDETPPTIAILEPQILEVKEKIIPLKVQLHAGGPSPITRYEILLNGTELKGLSRELPKPEKEALVAVDVELTPGQDNLLKVVAYNEAKRPSEKTLSIRNILQLVHEPQFYVASVGVDTFDKWPELEIPKADSDSQDVWEFFRDLTDRTVKKNENDGFVFAGPPPLTGSEPNQKPEAATIRRVFDALRSKMKAREIHAEDTVVLWLETHLQWINGKAVFLAADSVPGAANSAVPADEVKAFLLELKQNTGMVILLVDVLHQKTPAWPNREAWLWLAGWMRELSEKGIVVANAAKGNNFSRRGDTNGIFAQAVVESTKGSRDPRSMTLSEFGDQLTDKVARLSGNDQFAELLIPAGFERKRFLKSKVSDRALAVRGRRHAAAKDTP